MIDSIKNTTVRPVLFFVFFLCVYFLGVPQARAAWYDPSWSYRVKITVDNTQVSADLTDFPVYVDLADLPAGFHTNVKTDGSDIRVTTSDEVTEVPREVEVYDSGTDAGELHFKAPTLADASDTEFYIYYGNAGASEPAASATYGSQNVWDSSFAAVYHLGEAADGTTGEIKDSTANANDGTGAGTSGFPSSVTGKVGQGSSFSSSNGQYITVPDDASLNPTAITMEAWVNGTSFPNGYNTIVHKGNGTTYYEYFVKSTGKLAEYLVRAGGSASYDGTGTNTLSTGTWYMATMIYSSGGGLVGLVNGASDKTTSSSGNLSSTAGTVLSIGRDSFTPSRFWNGPLDEVRISSVARTTTWVSTGYNNQNAPATFYAVSAQEAYSSGSPARILRLHGHIRLLGNVRLQ